MECPMAQAMLKEGHKHFSGVEEAVMKSCGGLQGH